MASTQLPPDLMLDAVGGRPRPLSEWLITFQMLTVVLDPFTYESSWILETARKSLAPFNGSSVRTSFVLTSTEDQAREFLGPWIDEVLTYVDPDRDLVRALDLEQLPALVHIRQDASVGGVGEGWDPDAWQAVLRDVAADRNWLAPVLPQPGDPQPFKGSPALG